MNTDYTNKDQFNKEQVLYENHTVSKSEKTSDFDQTK